MPRGESAFELSGDVCIIYHSTGAVLELSGLADLSERPTEQLIAEVAACWESTVVVVDATMLPHADDLIALPPHVIVVAADAASEDCLGDRLDLSLSGLSATARTRVLRTACNFSISRVASTARRRLLTRTRRDLDEVNKIGIGLMHEHDQQVLIEHIVEQGMLLTGSDGGCLFLLERIDHTPYLRPAIFSSHSLPHVSPEAMGHPPPLPVDHTSIVGHAAVVKRHVVIADAYDLPSNAGFTNNVDFEREFGYYVKSMLVVPMIDHRRRLTGVLAFVNRKRDHDAKVRDKLSADRHVVTYTHREVRLGRALASVAAISLENTTLYTQIEHIFESFVKAAVSAIDQRDPSTAGHSVRVATLTTGLAQAVQRETTGRYRDLRFTRDQLRELRYAALLHDLGKVGVREHVLLKAKKLPLLLWERVEARFALIRRTLEVEYHRRARYGGASRALGRGTIVREVHHMEQLAELDRLWEIVRAANEPASVVRASDLRAIAARSFPGPDGSPMYYLTQEELRYLLIPHGTLDVHERDEIQSHVEQTYQFLQQIPWTDDLKDLAAYAYGHHEKLDGSGYPRGLMGDDIPVQTRLMTIADIFDALTASDRPYKQAVPPDRALDIIQSEAKAGLLDDELVRVLIESQVYTQILKVSEV